MSRVGLLLIWGICWTLLPAAVSIGQAPVDFVAAGFNATPPEDVTVTTEWPIESLTSAAPTRGNVDPPPPGDLSLGNFFSTGWDEDFTRRKRSSGTPDIALLRVPTNYQNRLFGSTYALTSNLASASVHDTNSYEAFIGWSFNRRIEVLAYGNYQWFEARTGPNLNGGVPGLATRVQLVDTDSSSACFNFRAYAPNAGLGSQQSTLTSSLAGFEDLGYWLGWDRVGWYWSVILNNYAGPAAVGTKQSDTAYDISIAKTITQPDTPLLGNFTLFLEHYGQTDLDGAHAGRTLVSITPGVRFNLGNCPGVKLGINNLCLFGVDLPISDPKPWDAVYRFAYFKDF